MSQYWCASVCQPVLACSHVVMRRRLRASDARMLDAPGTSRPLLSIRRGAATEASVACYQHRSDGGDCNLARGPCCADTLHPRAQM
eukprot:3983241-Pleurochrysis_carterae.AAC.1